MSAKSKIIFLKKVIDIINFNLTCYLFIRALAFVRMLSNVAFELLKYFSNISIKEKGEYSSIRKFYNSKASFTIRSSTESLTMFKIISFANCTTDF